MERGGRSLQPFLPSHLVRALGEAPDLDELPRRDAFDAALLFADLSGFTALTEALQRRGREGAEEVTDLLRLAFRPVLTAVHRAGGSIVSFGGDAVFVLFEGAAGVRRALEAARAIQGAFEGGMRLPTSAGPVTLAISQALHHGRVEGLHLGTPSRRVYVAGGAPVVALAALEARAVPGELLVSPAAAARERREVEAGLPAAPVHAVTRSRLEPYVAPHVLSSAGHFRGEYRHAVMMFLETRGFRLPQLQTFACRLVEVLDRYEGILVGTDLSRAGTKWLCAFGAPVAHEDDAERAARAALEMRAPIDGLALRGGLHLGVVANIWVGAPWRRSYELIGDATNTAARAAAAARWGEVVATAEAAAAVPGLVARPRGSHRVKGKAAPLELVAVAGMERRAAPGGPMVPLLGRDREMALLRARLEAAAEGAGSAVAVEGDAGLGKSRIKLEIARAARAAGFDVHEARAPSFGGGALQVAVDLLRAKLGLRASGGGLVAKVRRFARQQRIPPLRARRLEEALAGAPSSGVDAKLDPETLRGIRAGALALAALAAERPQLLVLEDMHWADPASRAFAGRLAAGAAASHTLVLLLHRPGFVAPDGAERLLLRELSRGQVRGLLRAILGAPSRSVQELVASRAGGNPFYVEEVARHLLETGVLERRGAALRVVRAPRLGDLPATVEAVIAARLSRLSPAAARLCQIGAVLGRTFSPGLVARHPDLRGRAPAALAELAQRELVFEIGDAEHRECIFKHAITRDVAYASILVAQRRPLHRWVAAQLEREGEGEPGRRLALQAHHWEEAGLVARARARYASAARQAELVQAHDDAIRLYRRHLALAGGGASAALLDARVRLGSLLRLTGAFDEGRAELEAVAERSSGRVRRRQRMDALATLGELELERNDPASALPRLQEALVLSRALGDDDREARILLALGRVHLLASRLDDAEDALARAGALFREAGDRSGLARVLARQAILRDGQGRGAEATPLLEQALAIHRESGDRAAQGEVLGFLGASWTHRAYHERGARYFRQALEIARELGQRRLEGMWSNNLGIATEAGGELEEAATHFQHAIKVLRALGVPGYLGQAFGNLAQVRAKQGRFEEADALVGQALDLHRERGDRRSEAQTLGVLAKLRETEGRLEEAAIVNARALALCVRLQRVAMEVSALRRQLALLRVTAPRSRRMDAALARSAELLPDHPSEALLALICERGHAALVRGESAEPELARARDLIATLGIEEGNDDYAAFQRLQRAQECHSRGEPLEHGLHPGDVGEPVRRWERQRPAAS